MQATRLGSVKKKILLLLKAGLVLYCAGQSARKQNLVYKWVANEWREINRISLKQSLDSLYQARLIEIKANKDGTFTMAVSDDGMKVLERIDLDNLKITPQKTWDRKWRMVLFDVPEKMKKIRNAIRFHLKNLEFVEYQKSVFIIPYPCEKEIKFLAEFHKAFKYVRLVIAEDLDDERKFFKKFKLD